MIVDLRKRLEMSANLMQQLLSPRQITAMGNDGAMLLNYLSGSD